MSAYHTACLLRVERLDAPSAPDLLSEGFLRAGASAALLDALDEIAGQRTAGAAPERFARGAAALEAGSDAQRSAFYASEWLSPWAASLLRGRLGSRLLREKEEGEVVPPAAERLDHAMLAWALASSLDRARFPPVALKRLTFEVASYDPEAAPGGDRPGWMRGFCAQLAAEADRDGPDDSRIGSFFGDPFDIFYADGWPVVWAARLVEERTLPLADAAFVEQRRKDPLVRELSRMDWSGRWDPLESTCRHASLSIL